MGSSSTTSSEAKDFIISYNKRTKMTPRTDSEKEEEDQISIIIGEAPYTSSKFDTSPTGYSLTQGQKYTELAS